MWKVTDLFLTDRPLILPVCVIHSAKLNFKGYLRYKTITSQNVPSEAQVKNIFVSYKSFILFSRYSSFCIFNHPVIYQICDIMVSISTWDRVDFWICLLNHNSLCHQTSSIDRYNLAQYFYEIFWTIWSNRAKFQALFSLLTFRITQQSIMSSFQCFIFLKGWIGEN